MKILVYILTSVILSKGTANECGCKYLRPCYKQMLKKLLQPDEDPCIENVSIGASTIHTPTTSVVKASFPYTTLAHTKIHWPAKVTIFLKALGEYCERVIKVHSHSTTHEGRNLYEVVINSSLPSAADSPNVKKPVILLEAGQDGGTESVGLALYVIEQLVACGENKDMIQNVKWVILPSTNPDGQEYVRTRREPWKKNYSPNGKDITSFGVDITRNFDDSWAVCPPVKNAFSQDYPGPNAGSEKEIVFINDVFARYKSKINTYVSLRRDGHAILYPLASRNITITTIDKLRKRAGDIAAKVNQRAGGIQWFVNQSIFAMNGKGHCGHSVDIAYNKYDIEYAFEMRVFPETDNRIMSKFQTLPKGHEVSLRTGYFSGIREVYNAIVSDLQIRKGK